MNRDEFLLQHKKLCDEAHNILQEKVQNYSGGGNVFTNFSRVESLGICSTPTGILARISDKFGRLITHTNTKGGLVGEEGFHDSIIDLINYLVFLYCSTNPRRIDDGKDTDRTETG